jgi:hypothetical protein
MTPAQFEFLTAALKELPALFDVFVQVVNIFRRGEEPLIVARPKARSVDDALAQARREMAQTADTAPPSARDTDDLGDELDNMRADVPDITEAGHG